MAPEKFETKVKRELQEREIPPSAGSWDRLEQRMEQRSGVSGHYFWWISAGAAIALVFFLLGSYFSAEIAAETPAVVEETRDLPILQEKKTEPEVLQIAASEVEEVEEKTSGEAPAKNAILRSPVSEASKEEEPVASITPSEATKVDAEEKSAIKPGFIKDLKFEIAAQDSASGVSDEEIEALLLLATAQIRADSSYTLSADDLLYQVEYELEQSFRQRVLEVVKESLVRAKSAVANRNY